MATARRMTRQVSTAPIPGVRDQSAETDISTGAGLEQARAQKDERIAGVTSQMAGAATGALSVVIKEERQKANETALLKASNQLEAWKREALYNPDHGALTLKGEAAQGLPEKISAEFEKVSSDIAAGLGTDEQRHAFDQVRSQVFASTDLEVRRHVFGEMDQFRADEMKSAVANGTDAAIRSAADPELVALNLNRLEGQMRTNLPRLGVGPQQLEEQVAAVRSSVHTGVISQLLATNQDKDAADYFKEVKEQIAADKLDEVEKALEEGSIRGESQKTADVIIAAGGTLKEQLAKAKDLDPKVREQVEQRIEHQNIVDERQRNETEKETMRSGYDIIDKTGNVANIPPAMWTSFDGSTRSAMRSYAEQKARGIPTKTDEPTFYRLMRQAMDAPEEFSNANLLTDRHNLSDGDFQQLAGIQLSIKNGDRAQAERDIADFRTSSQVVDDALVGIGINPNALIAGPNADTAGAEAVANLRRMVDIRVATLQDNTKHKASSKDVQDIVDELLASKVKQPGSWFGALPFTNTPFFDTSKPLINSTISDIPKDQRQLIETALQQRGRPVTDATILSTYLEAVARGKVK